MTNLSRASKGLGLAGTVLTHCAILFVCLFFATQATPTPLPPPVQAVRISLADPVAEAKPEPVAAASAPVPPPLPEEVVPPETMTVTPAVPKKPKPKVEKPQASPPDKPQPPVADITPPVETPAVRPVETAAAPARGSAQREEARQTLLSALIARIEREKRYPVAARRLGHEGQIMAVVQVDAQGRISSVRTQENQADASLQKATLEALRRVQSGWRPIPVPEPMTLNIPIRYSLKNS